MKKNILVMVTVIGLLALVIVADKTTTAGEGGGSTQIIDLQGKDLDLTPYKGKVVLLNFWATYCEPCQVEMPRLIEIQEKYESRGFTILGVGMDPEGRSLIEPYLQKTRFTVGGTSRAINYPILIGNDTVGDSYQLFGMPTSIVISRDGKKVKTFIGLVKPELLIKEIEGQL